MEKTDVEILYEQIDDTTESVQQHRNETYLDSLAVTLGTLLDQQTPEEMEAPLKKEFQKTMERLDVTSYETTDVRKAIQLAILKGMKGATQEQHLMTPETVALFVGYLAGKLTSGLEHIRLFDPTSGTGNLLMAVLDQLDKAASVYASEVDPTLIRLAMLNANMQKKEVEFFHQDSLRPFLLDPVDLVISDLPVGYYPDDVRSEDFELKADEGHSYSHHLLIEQAMRYTAPGGYLIFVIPEFLFDSDQSDKLHAYLQEYAHIIGVLQLPETAFKSEKNRKSLLILQKRGPDTSSIKQPLLVQVPSFKNTKAMDDILTQMNAWFAENMNI
ncbi:class I SAM-dependent methyltransferase [Lentibacillus halophilus]|uniref:Class I SAM-dependent methyltransferase n=1 Tax=Lentibacillus halophilus TaxID=295065 RepID=A0ABN0Z2N2_9BACI